MHWSVIAQAGGAGHDVRTPIWNGCNRFGILLIFQAGGRIMPDILEWGQVATLKDGEVTVGYAKGFVEAADTIVQKEMIPLLEKQIRTGTVHDRAVRKLIKDWLQAGMLARGDGYWKAITSPQPAWQFSWASLSDQTPVMQLAQDLLVSLRKLHDALFHDLANLKGCFQKFNEAEDAFLKFVHQYRLAMAKPRRATWDHDVISALNHLSKSVKEQKDAIRTKAIEDEQDLRGESWRRLEL